MLTDWHAIFARLVPELLEQAFLFTVLSVFNARWT